MNEFNLETKEGQIIVYSLQLVEPDRYFIGTYMSFESVELAHPEIEWEETNINDWSGTRADGSEYQLIARALLG
jgi:hypothetical protein